MVSPLHPTEVHGDSRMAWMTALGAFALALSSTTSIGAEPAYDHHIRLTPDNSVVGNFPAQKAPILAVKSGATVRIDGGGGNRWGEQSPQDWLKRNNVPASLQDIGVAETYRVVQETKRYADIKTGHLLVGPVAIEGAMPGDMLEVRILSVETRIPYGAVSMRPGSGAIPDSVPQAHVIVIPFDKGRTVGFFEPNIEVPLAPFMGVMGTLPPETEGANRRSGPPGLFGGNLDCKELTTGATLYLPVFHPGALFFTGDSHAAQGDGEVTGNAIETANTAVLKFILHKGKTIKVPRAETPTHYIAFGLDPDLDDAMQMAIHEANKYLEEIGGLNFYQAFALSSIAVDFRITQVVDGTKGIHAMIPKVLFKNRMSSYWFAPGLQRQITEDLSTEDSLF